MAKRSAPKIDVADSAGILPVPATLIRHHGQTVLGPMREWVQQKRIPPVLLLTGTAGSGKRNLAHWLAQWILCEKSGFTRPSESEMDQDPFTSSLFGDAPAADENPAATPAPSGDLGPCGECPSCLRALKGNWVDFTEVLPEDSDGEATTSGGTLKVDQFRKIKSTLGFGAHEGAYKIVLIPAADRMTVQAANSVLKLLEEPPRGWIFFLTASDPTLVLPTILSRCQALRLKPLSAKDLEELLQLAGVDSKRLTICAELAQGSWSKALALSSEEIWDHRQTLFSFLKNPASELSGLVDWASQVPSNFDLLVDQLESLTSELIRWSVSATTPEAYPWISADGKPSLITHAKSVTGRHGGVAPAREFWMDRAERMARVRQEALAPLNRKLLIQDLLLPWLQAM